MPIIGYLSNKVDPRYLLTFGFLTFGLTTLYFGNVTLDISPTTLLLPILITGFGLSFVFVPINTAAYGTLDNEQIGNASGLFNLMRNVGGSIGISIAPPCSPAAPTSTRTRSSTPSPAPASSSRAHLAASPARPHQLLRPRQHPRPRPGTPLPATRRQATNWAFVDVFRWLSLLCFFCVGIVWLFKKVKPGKPPAGAH